MLVAKPESREIQGPTFIMETKARTALGRAAIAGAILIAAPAAAQQATGPTHAWTLAADYKADVAGVAAGGIDRGARYLDNINIVGDVDLGRAVGWQRAAAHVSLLNNLGGRPNDLAGSIQGINNIEVTERHLKVYEAWLEQGVGATVTLKAGLYDVNSEFYQNDAAGLLISPMFGVGSELAATGVNGPAIFPSTALAARLRVTAGQGYAAIAVVNAHAGTIGDEGGIDLSGRDGALLIGEAGWTGSGRIAIGAWCYTQDQPEIVAPGLTPTGDSHASGGVYLLAEHDLLGHADDVRHLTGFLRLGLSEGRTTPFSGGWQTGLSVEHVFAARPASAVSIGGGSGFLSRTYRSGNPAGLPPLGRTETILEATYSDELVHGVSLQPDVQYVIHPSADPSIADALVVGLRLTLSWSSH